MAAAGNNRPPVSFHFRVDVIGFPGEAGFQSVDGLDVTIKDFPFEEGGVNTFTHHLPDRISYGDLTLKRGMLVGSLLVQWFRAGVDLFTFVPTDVIVTLLNEKHAPIDAWIFHNAWPKGWKIEGFDASSNKVAVESIIIAYQRFERVGIPLSI
jgi:phage tail-like protein